MDLGTAIKKPTTDIKNLAIGAVLSIIPLVSALTIPGYMIRVANKTMNKDNSLPSFGDFGELVMDSLKYIVISIVYMIPAMIVFGFAVGSVIGAIIGAISPTGGDPSAAITNALLSSMATAGIFLVVGIILAIIGGIMALSGVMNYAKTKEFGKAFAFGEVLGNFFNGGFLIAVIVTLVIYIVAGIIGGLLLMIPLLGMILWVIILYMAEVAGMTILAEAYP